MTTIRERLRASPGARPVLADVDPRSTPGIDDRGHAEAAMPGLTERLGELQERLWAEHERSLLVVLQAMDTGGKDGAIEHVFRAMDPAGVDVAAFKEPTPQELEHPFLWRIERRLPTAGEIVIFNRSHYEDVVVVRVHELVPRDEWSARYDEINAWEEKVVAAGTTLVKCFLHISYDEQRERLLARLDDPDKHWKFSEGDIDERARWEDYQAAYGDAIARCSTAGSPWYVIPADRKWYRNWAVASLVAESLDQMDPRYPRPGLDVPRLKARLAPPN